MSCGRYGTSQYPWSKVGLSDRRRVSCLNRRVSRWKMNLLKVSACQMASASTGATPSREEPDFPNPTAELRKRTKSQRSGWEFSLRGGNRCADCESPMISGSLFHFRNGQNRTTLLRSSDSWCDPES